MGSTFSAILACIYLEFLESGLLKYIISCNSNCFQNIDNIQLIFPQELDLVNITDGLNKIEPTLNLTPELRTNNTLPFLNILHKINNEKLHFKVLLKPPVKNVI